MKRFIILGLFLAGFCLMEPCLRDKLTYAVSYPDLTTLNQGISGGSSALGVASHGAPSRAHAPEPSTLILLLSGLGGMIVRFARRNFERFKRSADLFLSAIALIVLSPIIAIAGILIKINSPGPIIYRQLRVGKNHKVFRIYKLRTMRVDAEKFTGAVWARENDPRITPIGNFLRKTHIDEIPQFINVLKGEMSIVGPRPERPEMVRTLKQLIKDYEKRLEVNPGITGLAQAVHKYDETVDDVKKKIKYDLLYIRKMCLWTDLRILGQTAIVVFTGKGAR